VCFPGEGFREIPVVALSGSVANVDIKVLALTAPLTEIQRLPLDLKSDGLVLSQDVFFVGFPYKIYADNYCLHDGRPMPVVKRGNVAQLVGRENFGESLGGILVDGYANPGFSGGPLVFSPPGTNEVRIAGVVSRFREEEEPVVHKDNQGWLPYVVKVNTGLFHVDDISHAVTAIPDHQSRPASPV
jgi:hypothetical protein